MEMNYMNMPNKKFLSIKLHDGLDLLKTIGEERK